MNKFEMLEKLQDAGIDVAEELVRAMNSDQADDLLGYVARMWGIEEEEEEEEEEDEDDTPRYADPDIQAAYEFACEWVCEDAAAAYICDQCGAYGSTIISVSAEEWYRDADMREDYTCLIGEDVALNTFIIELH